MTQLALLSSPDAPGGYLESSAVISPCERYRYSLVRVWDRALPRVLFCGLNPSTADALEDDPTIRREVGFAKSWGCGSLEKVNIFGWRSTDPDVLLPLVRSGVDPIGLDNDAIVAEAAKRAKIIVAAWGSHPAAATRSAAILYLLAEAGDVWCLGRTKDGCPKHPLYLRKDTCRELLARRVDTKTAHGARE